MFSKKKIDTIPIIDSDTQLDLDENALKGVELFFNNQLDEAEELFKTGPETDPLYRLTLATKGFFKACITFNHGDVDQSIEELNHVVNAAQVVIDKCSPTSITSTLTSYLPFSGKAEIMSNMEFRARIIKAEALLLTALMQLLQESILAYVKAGFNLRKGYLEYQATHQAFLKSGGTDSSKSIYDNNSVTGIYFGVGTTNLLLSALPSKILKVVAVLGIKGDRQLGFQYLRSCIQLQGVRTPLSLFFLQLYHALFLSFCPSFSTDDIETMGTLVETSISAYPKSSFFHLMAARYYRAKRQLEPSNQALEVAAQCPPSWKQFELIASYELGLNYLFQLQWDKAATHFKKLSEADYWSRPLFLYLLACCHFHTNQLKLANELWDKLETENTRKYGGKVISVEKFINHKLKLRKQGNASPLPGLEMIAIWGGFDCMPSESLDTSEKMISDALKQQDSSTLHFLLGCVTKEIVIKSNSVNLNNEKVIDVQKDNAITEYQFSRECFEKVLQYPDDQVDSHLKPFTLYELATIDHMDGQITKAKQKFEDIDNYKGYFFEYRLALRLQLVGIKLTEPQS